MINEYIEDESAVFISFHIETGGKYCRILQINSELFTLDKDCNKGGDTQLGVTFDCYIKPSESEIWSDHITKIHGLYNVYSSIVDADPLGSVWDKFILYLNENIPIGKQGVLVAWNGDTCDMEWCYRVMYGPNATVSFPRQLQLFMDPLEII